jgi:myo-inositol-1(or 4)-monophosphatase
MYLTEEDLTIERGMKEIIKKHNSDHYFFAEEEHDSFPDSDHVWIADPISGTNTFIQGRPHYGIVIAHSFKGIVQFAAIYDPSVDELFIAYKGKGAFLNGKKISFSNNNKKIIFTPSYAWKDKASYEDIEKKILKNFEVHKTKFSHGVALSHVACGRYDGVISLCKDSFPLFAASLIIQEAGGIFTNLKGESNIHHGDRIFLGGNKETYAKLKEILESVKFS